VLALEVVGDHVLVFDPLIEDNVSKKIHEKFAADDSVAPPATGPPSCCRADISTAWIPMPWAPILSVCACCSRRRRDRPNRYGRLFTVRRMSVCDVIVRVHHDGSPPAATFW